jgi:hypothetical protein
MSTLTLDFRHNYFKGERRVSNQITYQWDLGHTLEIFVPENSGYEIHYYFEGADVTDDYAVESTSVVAPEDGGGYRLTAHVPNLYFERYGDLNLLIVGSNDDHVLTTYEGYIPIRKRVQPEDYVDDDPTNGAETIIARAREYAKESEAWAVGTIDGEAVPSTAPQYQNHAKHYAERASGYVSDLAGYLNNFAPSETSPAESAHSTGTYIVYGSQLYKVTADIAVGDTLAEGTNIDAVTVNEVMEIIGTMVDDILDEISNLTIWKQAQAIASTGGSSGTLCTITDSSITADHVLTKFVPASGAAIISGVTCTTSAGQAVITGISTAATTAEIVLDRPTVVS